MITQRTNKILLIFFLSLISYINGDNKCRVLVLEGGGDRGAYHAGAFYQMVELLPPQEVAYDIITGVSVGGINAIALSFFEKGDEKNARDYLINIWNTIERRNVWKTWSIWRNPLMAEKGLLDNSPLRDWLLIQLQSHTIKRKFSVGTTDQLQGKFVRITNEDVLNVDDQLEMLMSTSAIPGIFPFNNWRNSSFVDGGQMKQMDVIGGINFCRQSGFQDSDIVIDAILCLGKGRPSITQQFQYTFQNIMLSIDNFQQRMIYGDLNQAMEDFPEVVYRYIVNPDFIVDHDTYLLFDRQKLNEYQESGKQDALNVIERQSEGQKSFQAYLKVLKEQKQQ